MGTRASVVTQSICCNGKWCLTFTSLGFFFKNVRKWNPNECLEMRVSEHLSVLSLVIGISRDVFNSTRDNFKHEDPGNRLQKRNFLFHVADLILHNLAYSDPPNNEFPYKYHARTMTVPPLRKFIEACVDTFWAEETNRENKWLIEQQIRTYVAPFTFRNSNPSK